MHDSPPRGGIASKPDKVPARIRRLLGEQPERVFSLAEIYESIEVHGKNREQVSKAVRSALRELVKKGEIKRGGKKGEGLYQAIDSPPRSPTNGT